MKNASPFHIAPAAFVLAAFVSLAALAHAQAPAEHHEHMQMPAPTNLQVLPKTMTADQVHEIMHHISDSLGTHCTTCHATDPTRKMPNGQPAINFADDSKPEKATARLMMRMVNDINTGYIAKIDNSGMPVTCGTCHRGHLSPEPFVPPPDNDHDHDHDHAAPPAAPH